MGLEGSGLPARTQAKALTPRAAGSCSPRG